MSNIPILQFSNILDILFTFDSDDRLSDMLYKNDIFGYYIIVIPEKRFKDNSTMDLIYEQFNKEISEDSWSLA